ncbi:MAG: hypothetical protein K2X01_02870 [Cyanobacteria bacterium]|nr:hypothetical protein [Cyanobacteriota bacterium]
MKINPTQQLSTLSPLSPRVNFAGTRVVLDPHYGPLQIVVEPPSRDRLPYDTLQLEFGDRKCTIQGSEIAQFAEALDSFPPDAPSAETDAFRLANRMVGVFRRLISPEYALDTEFIVHKERILRALNRLSVSVERNMATHGVPDAGFKAVFKEGN